MHTQSDFFWYRMFGTKSQGIRRDDRSCLWGVQIFTASSQKWYEILIFDKLNRTLEKVSLPSSLQSLTFGFSFNQTLERVSLPSCLQSLTFGCNFNQSLTGVILPSSLQSLTFGYHCDPARIELANQSSKLDVSHRFPIHSTTSSREWAGQMVFRAWHLASVLTRHLKEWACQAVSRAWRLDAISTSP